MTVVTELGNSLLEEIYLFVLDLPLLSAKDIVDVSVAKSVRQVDFFWPGTIQNVCNVKAVTGILPKDRLPLLICLANTSLSKDKV